MISANPLKAITQKKPKKKKKSAALCRAGAAEGAGNANCGCVGTFVITANWEQFSCSVVI